MKPISICLIIAAMCLSSCKPMMDGGCIYEGVYIETVTGRVNAHGYQIMIPGSGGEFDYYLDCVRPFYNYYFEKDGLSISFADEVSMTGIGEKTDEGYVKARLHLSVPPNQTGEERSDELRIGDVASFYCAIITVRQDIIPY